MLFRPATFAVVAFLLTGQVISVPTPGPFRGVVDEVDERAF